MSKVDFILDFILTSVVLASLIGFAITKKELDTIKSDPHKIIQENMSEYAQHLSDDSLHSLYLDDYKNSGVLGYYQGSLGVESYYNLNWANSDVIVGAMRQAGYSEEEYPFWLREDGVYMLGDYVMCCTGDEYKYGDIIPTSLGDGIVCDHASFGRHIDVSYGKERIVGTYVLDVYTDYWY